MSCIKKNAKFEVLRQNETSEGFLDLTGYISKADYVMEYYDWWEEKINKEFIPLEELQKVVNQAKGLILTDLHPWEFIDAKNATEYTNGFVTEVHGIEDKKLKVDIRVINSDLINDIRSGQKDEFSIGYFCELVNEKGLIEGIPYDSKQVNLQLNHVALVPNGRAGEDVGVLVMNSEEKVSYQKDMYKKLNAGGNMKAKYNGKDYEANELVVELMARDKELETKQNSLDEVSGKVAGLEADNKELTEKVNNFESTLETEIEKKINTVNEVSKLTGKETKDLLKMNSLELKKEVINKAYEGMDLEGKSEGFIDGLYTGAVSKLNSATDVKPTPAETSKKENGADPISEALKKLNGGK
ncbi:MAG: DUF2213 domain-containing protein [Cetobacterium somerae]|uniref:DUF2213 domain-containing protein n=1 Tax=Cetobacterium somerae TaxID=188913 RepID=UPI003F3E3918